MLLTVRVLHLVLDRSGICRRAKRVRCATYWLLAQGRERPVDVPLVDAVDVARFVGDPPAGGLIVPPLPATAQLALAFPRRGDGHAHTSREGAVQQKDTVRVAAAPPEHTLTGLDSAGSQRVAR